MNSEPLPDPTDEFDQSTWPRFRVDWQASPRTIRSPGLVLLRMLTNSMASALWSVIASPHLKAG